MFKRTYYLLSSFSKESLFYERNNLPNLSYNFIPPVMMREARFPIRHRLPSVMMRSGTSKGLFLHRKHLPQNQSEWGPVLLSVMGSKQGDQKQLDGIGGGTSTTSKVAIVSKSSRPDADVDYTFVQVAVGKGEIDFSGNCGNMACGVGPFALDEGLVHAIPGQTTVREPP
jgi:2-methylaconitate cis-trans-isomerase PrpF